MNKIQVAILSVISIVGLLAVGALLGGYLPKTEQEKQLDKLGATITTLNATDLIKDSRSTINDNFSNLNTSKLEASDLLNFQGLNNPIFNTFTATSTTATSTISWGLAAIQRLGIGSIATTTILGNTSTSTFSCCITTGGLASSNGLTLTGGNLLSSGLFTNTNTGTSTFSGDLTLGTNGFFWNSSGNTLSIGGGEATLTVAGISYKTVFVGHNEGATDLVDYIAHRHSNTAALGSRVGLTRSRGTEATKTVVQSGDVLGRLYFTGYDGTDYALSSLISGEVDGTPGAGDMPGRIVWSTSLDGTETLTERMRLTNAGNFGIGSTSPSSLLSVSGGVTTPLVYFNQTSSGNLLNIALNGADKLVLTNGGNLGLGTSTPGLLLSVAGNTLFGGSTGTTTIEHGTNLATKGGSVNIGTSSPFITTFGGSTLYIAGSAAADTCYPATGATITVDWGQCNSARVTLSQAGHTVNFQGGTPGQKFVFTALQDSTGNRSISTYGTGIFFFTTSPTNSTTSPGMTTKAFTANKMSCEVQPSTTTPATALQYECTLYSSAKQ